MQLIESVLKFNVCMPVKPYHVSPDIFPADLWWKKGNFMFINVRRISLVEKLYIGRG